MSSSTSPGIIFHIEAHPYKDSSEKNAFFRCHGSRTVIDYLSRKSACDKNDIQAQHMLESASDTSYKDIISYAKDRPGSTGFFGQNGDFSQEEIKEIRENLRKTKSIIWSSVISFTPELAAQFCHNRQAATEIINNNLEVLFKNSQLDYENIKWAGAYHINTVHPHIHLLFWEKEPLKIDKFGRNKYCSSFKLPTDNLNNFKFAINRSFSSNNLDYLPMRDQIRAGMRTSLNNNQRMYAMIYNSALPILNSGVNQYGRLSKEHRSIVDKLVKSTISLDSRLNKLYNNYCNNLLNTQKEYRSLYIDNHIKVPDKVHNFYDSRLNELQSRLGNQFLKLMREYKSTQIVIQKEIDKSNTKDLSNDSRRIRIRNIKNRNSIGPILTHYRNEMKEEMLVGQNQLDRYRDMLRRRGEELIDEEYLDSKPQRENQ